MDIETFWKLIDTAREESGGDTAKQADLLVNTLAQLSLEEIFTYETIWDDLMDFAYDAALWDAAYIIGCGCGDDGFWDFRAWLIAQGKEIYEKALADPESLVDLIDVDKNGQEGYLINAVLDAYEQKMGEEMPSRQGTFSRPMAQLKGTHRGEDQAKARFPKLTAKFGDCNQRFEMML